VGARGRDLALGIPCKTSIMCGRPEHWNDRCTQLSGLFE
jgi:hypothetical protein